MADINRSCTPEPPSFIRTPPTPRHGGDYEPFRPRKSTRISAQRNAQTPPPPSNILRSSHHASSIDTPPATAKKTTRNILMASPPPSIVKKHSKRDVLAVEDTTSNATSSAAPTMGASSSSRMDSMRSTSIRGLGMLPTPDKTPKKRPFKPADNIKNIARTLFPVRPETIEEVMPSPRKARKHYTLGGLGPVVESDEEEGRIQVYTDSHDRVPELDESEDNPFLHAQPSSSEPPRRSSKRLKVEIPGEGEVSVEEAQKREDGLIYVFRGKKVFRKFAANPQQGSQIGADDTDEEIDAALADALPASQSPRCDLSRSQLKPRLLFPTVEQAAARAPRATLRRVMSSHEEEEADTDIEEPADTNDLTTDIDTDIDVELTPSTHLSAIHQTPKAPRFAPASPPTTLRTTRSKHIPVDKVHKRKTSPFDAWQRTKPSAAATPPSVGNNKKRPRQIDSPSSPKRLRSGI